MNSMGLFIGYNMSYQHRYTLHMHLRLSGSRSAIFEDELEMTATASISEQKTLKIYPYRLLIIPLASVFLHPQ